MTRREWLPGLGLIVIVLLLALPILTYPLGRDQGEFATIGRGILQGKAPYSDLWNPKPPAVFYVYALAMALYGQTTAALRAIDLILLPVIGVALYWLGWQLSQNLRTGLLAVAMFGAFYFTETFWTLTQNDGIVLVPMVLTVVLLFRLTKPAGFNQRVAQAAAIGALCGVIFWFKYPFAIFGLVIAAGYVLLARQQADKHTNITTHLTLAVACICGGLLVVGLGLLYMAAIGALPELLLSAQVTSQYTALTFNPADFTQLMRTALSFRWQHWGLLFVLAGLWLPLMLRQRLNAAWGVVVLWLLGGLAIMLIQAKGYDYHWLPMLPPLVLMGAAAADRLLTRAAYYRLTRPSQVSVTLLTVLLFLAIQWQGMWPKALYFLRGAEDQLAYYSRFQGGEFVADESLLVAEVLRERTTPGDSLYIWGFRPEIYYMTDLNPATRFIFQFPLVGEWYPEAWQQENVDTLWAALPPYVLVLQADYMPWVTGRDEDSNTLLQEYNELNNWLIFNYERDVQIGNFFLWRRKTP